MLFILIVWVIMLYTFIKTRSNCILQNVNFIDRKLYLNKSNFKHFEVKQIIEYIHFENIYIKIKFYVQFRVLSRCPSLDSSQRTFGTQISFLSHFQIPYSKYAVNIITLKKKKPHRILSSGFPQWKRVGIGLREVFKYLLHPLFLKVGGLHYTYIIISYTVFTFVCMK